MIRTIIMAKSYQKRPSELLEIDNGYLAYMVDEFSYFIEKELTDSKGNIHWDKIKFKDEKTPINTNNNDKFKEFLIKQNK